jgi:hypothetical protein
MSEDTHPLKYPITVIGIMFVSVIFYTGYKTGEQAEQYENYVNRVNSLKYVCTDGIVYKDNGRYLEATGSKCKEKESK